MRSTPGRALAPAAAAAAAAPAARRRSTARAAMPPAAARTALDEHAPDGAFAREAAVFRHSIEPGGRFPPAAGRYHLYISHACPWANRAHAVLRLKGLEGAVGVSVVHPTWQRTRPGDPADGHAGWAFRAPGDAPVTPLAGRGAVPCDGCVPDPLENAKFVRDLYEIAGDTGGKFTVPVRRSFRGPRRRARLECGAHPHAPV
jgi:putative glutathione S-transferase